MQYHALSLSQHDQEVYVLALDGATAIPAVVTAKNIHRHNLPQPPEWTRHLPTVIGLLIKAVFQLIVMIWMVMVKLPRPSYIIMQNPPAIPVMLVLWLASLRHAARLVIDWHNLAYTIMTLKYARHGWLINTAKAYERYFGKRAHSHFCVTKALQTFLLEQFAIQANVLYDRPPSFFQPTSVQQKHELFTRLQPQLQHDTIGSSLTHYMQQTGAPCTPFTHIQHKKGALLRSDRPALVVSSTSWTPDEDFSILLEAAQQYDSAASHPSAYKQYPDVLFIITGRGPEREMYLNRLRQIQMKRVSFLSLWLEAADYPVLLGTADLGVCLHTSSSGLDLPMKVVDMFGSGLPVCAAAYKCIDELIKPGATGLLFHDAQQLAQHLLRLLQGFPSSGSGELGSMKQEVAKQQMQWRWADNWDDVAWPVLTGAAN